MHFKEYYPWQYNHSETNEVVRYFLFISEGLDIGCDPCGHTLFIVTDNGFLYRFQAFDEIMGIIGIDEALLYEDDEVEGIDSFIDQFCVPNII